CIVSTNDEANFTESLVESPEVDDQRSKDEQSESPLQTAEDAAADGSQDDAETASPTEETTDDAS
ncbi:MAG: hypothetical protein L0K41_02545, partial [Yaniella sp.]|nr:hypothetical protein [Yaniella sp.]